jgi:uncharacterized protein (UPF0335 family)
MTSPDGSNGFNSEQLTAYLDEIDAADEELLRLAGEHKSACKPLRARIRNVMTQARDEGVNMTAFRTVVADHRSKRKIDDRIAALEQDDRADFEEMKRALGEFGDTPLGAHALERARPQDEAHDALRG